MDSRLLPYESLFSNYKEIIESKILVVGAGGIGCELLKNLVLSGFKHIEIIDLDTIDVSNLNRQFLFRSHHVGKSKSEIARETALKFNPSCNIIAHHGKIESPQFNVEYYKSFSVVMNALDNVAARQHVNRMCLAADVPLLDGGTAGYLGQVVTIKKDETECYECQPKQRQKSFAVCTIRSNPSTILHCVVWSKMVFERLYGKSSDENAIADFEKIQQIGDCAKFTQAAFDLLFKDQVEEASNMKDTSIFHSGKKPIPLDRKSFDEVLLLKNSLSNVLNQQRNTWSIEESIRVFLDVGKQLRERKISSGSELEFDKDDEGAMSFVTAASNLRAWNYHIDMKSLYEIKGMAGNIVPAIATTNAIISGLLILEAYKVLSKQLDKCRAIYCLRNPSRFKRKNCLIYPVALEKPNPDCYICSSNELIVRVNCKTTTLGFFISKILKDQLRMIEPSITFNKSLIYEFGEELDEDEIEEYKENEKKTLLEFEIGSTDRSTLAVEDFAQEIDWKVIVIHDETISPQEATITGKTQFEKSKNLESESKATLEETTIETTYKTNNDGILDLISDDENDSNSRKRKRENDDSRDTKRIKNNDNQNIIVLD